MTLNLAATARRWVVQTASRPYLALHTEDVSGLTEDGSWFRALAVDWVAAEGRPAGRCWACLPCC